MTTSRFLKGAPPTPPQGGRIVNGTTTAKLVRGKYTQVGEDKWDNEYRDNKFVVEYRVVMEYDAPTERDIYKVGSRLLKAGVKIDGMSAEDLQHYAGKPREFGQQPATTPFEGRVSVSRQEYRAEIAKARQWLAAIKPISKEERDQYEIEVSNGGGSMEIFIRTKGYGPNGKRYPKLELHYGPIAAEVVRGLKKRGYPMPGSATSYPNTYMRPGADKWPQGPSRKPQPPRNYGRRR